MFLDLGKQADAVLPDSHVCLDCQTGGSQCLSFFFYLLQAVCAAGTVDDHIISVLRVF